MKFGRFVYARVVFPQPSSHLAGFDSNDRVFAGIVGRWAMKQVHANGTLFQVVEVTGKHLLHNIGEKFLRTGAVAECRAVLDLCQVGQNLGVSIPLRIRKVGHPML
jgi:hypothetical protein